MGRLKEWKVMSQSTASAKTASSKDALWKTFIDAVIDYINSIPELSDLKTSHYGEGSTGIWRVLHIYDNLPESHDIRIRFNTETEAFEITTKYEDFKTIKGHGFNFLMSTLNDIAFTIFELGGFDFLSLRETFSIADDFKLYENLWDETDNYCWFGKYFDIKGNKKLVYISKEFTQDSEEADELIQENIPEPFTKFIFGGSIDRRTAEQEGWTELFL